MVVYNAVFKLEEVLDGKFGQGNTIGTYETWGDAYHGMLDDISKYKHVNRSSIRVVSMQGITIIRYSDTRNYYIIIDTNSRYYDINNPYITNNP